MATRNPKQRAPAQRAQPNGACGRRGTACRAGESRLHAPPMPERAAWSLQPPPPSVYVHTPGFAVYSEALLLGRTHLGL